MPAPELVPHDPSCLRSTLDALEAHIAVLDERGVIVYTNAAWESFALGNGGSPACGVGADYLAACDAAAGEPLAAEVATALRDLLMGRRTRFFVEYPCHAPDAERWFALRATRRAEDGVVRVVVKHTDVSDRILMRRALTEANDYLRAVTTNMAEGLVTLDAEHRVAVVNPAAEQLLGRPAGECVGRRFEDLVRAPVPAVGRTPSEATIARPDGSAIPVQYTVGPFETAGGVRGSVIVFSDISERKATEARLRRDHEALAWITRIKAALDHDRFVLHAQPIVDVRTGATVQHELLLRMVGDDGALIAPGAFLPVAEDFGLIREIDRWVVRQAARLAGEGHAVEANLSAESLGDPGLFGEVRRELEAAGADPRLVVLEVTETALLRDEEAARASLEGLSALGVRLALDDFGTGYGGFTYLKRLPFDDLKIDIEFVRDLLVEPASEHVVRAVVDLARGFGRRTVAEGVEDRATLARLRELGVDLAQGYGICRPGPLDDVLVRRAAA